MWFRLLRLGFRHIQLPIKHNKRAVLCKIELLEAYPYEVQKEQSAMVCHIDPIIIICKQESRRASFSIPSKNYASSYLVAAV